MILHNRELARIELNHGSFATKSDVKSLKTVVSLEMARCKATRGVIRVLTDDPKKDDAFGIEAWVNTPHGKLVYFGLNARSRQPSIPIIDAEMRYVAKVLLSKKLEPPSSLDIVRLESRPEVAAELAALYARTYSYFPQQLDEGRVRALLSEGIPYGVLEGGKIVSALFGSVFHYGPLTAVEFTLSATKPTPLGLRMTSALAARIRAEAIERFRDPLMIAETIAGPVMRSCIDLGMDIRGVLPEHYRLSIGERTYTNFYAWFL